MQRCFFMKHFKSLKSGMSLIEVMIALTIFVIFGSSLFMMQQYLFDRMMASQKKLIAFMRMQQELATYQDAILQELCDYEKGSVEKSLQPKEIYFSQPDMIIKIMTQSKFEGISQDHKETVFKDFKNLHLICLKAQEGEETDSFGYGKLFTCMYIPELKKDV